MKNLTLFIITVMLSACASVPKTYVDYDREHIFSGYETFSWAHSPPLISEGDTRLAAPLENAATDALKASLVAQGFRFVADQPDADFLVAYTVGSRKYVKIYPTETCVYSNKENWLWGKQYHSYFFDMVLHEDYRGSVKSKGVMALDIFDAKNRVPIWHSKIARTSIDNEENILFSSPKELAELTAKLVARFPPK